VERSASARAAAPAAPVEPSARLEARGAEIATPSGALAVQLQLDDEPAPASLGSPPAEPQRGRELPHLVLPRPELRSWSADDLDVPAFLRRQMD
jgi:hypothetical protein